jgi:hypothetical protein
LRASSAGAAWLRGMTAAGWAEASVALSYKRVQGPVVTHGFDAMHLSGVAYAPASYCVLSARVTLITMIAVARALITIYPRSHMYPFTAALPHNRCAQQHSCNLFQGTLLHAHCY